MALDLSPSHIPGIHPGGALDTISPDPLAPRLPAVEFNPPSQSKGPVSVSLSVPGHPLARIYYTTNQTRPNLNSLPYNGPISLVYAAEIWAIATEAGFGPSPLSKAAYPVKSQLSPVKFSPPRGQTPLSVSISLANHPAATIYYTLDGTTPTVESLVYTAPIAATGTAAITAIAVELGFQDSPPASRIYFPARLPAVQASPSGGVAPVSVTLSVPGYGSATIFYQLNSGPVLEYSVPISIDEPAALYTWATQDGLRQSNPVAFSYTKPLPTPILTSVTGNNQAPTAISISVPGHLAAEIHYTVDGTTPTRLSPRYNALFPPFVPRTALVQAIAYEVGYSPSPIGSYQVIAAAGPPVVVAGIGTSSHFGVPSLTQSKLVSPVGVGSATAVGHPNILTVKRIIPTGIPTNQAMGTAHNFKRSILPVGLVPGVPGSPSVSRLSAKTLFPVGLSVGAIGVPAVGFITPFNVGKLLNLDFGEAPSLKTGRASYLGAPSSTGDYWNGFYDVDPTGGTRSITNCLFSDKLASSIRIDLSSLSDVGNPPTLRGTLTHADPMFATFIYGSAPASTISITVLNLPAGFYDLYVYAHGSVQADNVEVWAGANGSTDLRGTTSNGSNWNSSTWLSGINVINTQVTVPGGGYLSVLCIKAGGAVASVNGIQIVRLS